ncbi:reverse transcriptase (RNA-dependent DNA polymerase) [Frigoribacterium sp. PhB116]|nr:reverse transcriptase (RNA-dependent DNA polymerase) [Frigoribacterium sp. PhB116]
MSSEELRQALLDRNFIPRASRRGDDLPPSLTTVGLSSVSGQVVANHTDGNYRSPKGTRAMPGYSVSDIRLAHYRWNPRRIELPHPVPYSALVETLAGHWDAVVAPRMNSDRAQFQIRQHVDGRVASMQQTRPHLRPGVGSRFRVHADIAAFYDSIYTHSIPWALLGKEVAKTNRGSGLPANQIDSALRFARRGETTGVSIGPGTSLIVAEILLQSVDQRLGQFRFERFLDDYVAYTKTETEAEEFVRLLESSLREFGLQLNGRKTTVEALPLPDEPGWIRELRRSNVSRPSEMIDKAIDMSLNDPTASAIQWALSRVRKEIAGYPPAEQGRVLNRLAELAFTHPHTTPVLVDALESIDVDLAADDIDTLLRKHANDRQSSAICWMLHLTWLREIEISDDSWNSIVAARDPLANAYLLRQPSRPANKTQQTALVDSLADPIDDYAKDEEWPARYIAFLDGREDMTDASFAELQGAGVKLLADPRAWEEEIFVDDPFEPLDTYDEDSDEDLSGLGLSG